MRYGIRFFAAFALRAASIAWLVTASACGVLILPEPSPVLTAANHTGSRAIAAYESLLNAQVAAYDSIRLRYMAALDSNSGATPPDWIAPVLNAIDDRARDHSGGRIAAIDGLFPGTETWSGRWREAQTFLYIGQTATSTNMPFRFPDQNTLSTIVRFRSIADSDATVTTSCDADVSVERPEGDRRYAANTAFELLVSARERDITALRLSPSVTTCTLTVKLRGAAPFVINMVGESAQDPAIAELDMRFDICAEPPPQGVDPLATAFFSGRWLSQTCSMPPTRMRLLPESRDGFNAKIEALTGSRLTDEAFEAGDPNVPLDFSDAPRFALIYLSYLDLKADFSGAIMARALRYHAERGTLIRILVSEILELEKDRTLYEGLAAEFPNIQLQLFSWQPPVFAPMAEQLAAIHRVHHIKLFVALSPDRGDSRAILGGRNIHDGFLFSEALDLSAYPELQDYGEPGELSLAYFSTYHDFEVELQNADTVRTLAAHLSTFWHRDFGTTVFRPFSIGSSYAGDAPLTGMRHFVSVPYLDDRALERFWIELIDAAEESVEIVTPYLNPTRGIEAAINRALTRGVEVTIVARIELYGDLGGRLMTEMNMLFVEAYADKLTIYEYDPPDVVLHTKMLLIDRRLSIISSVNLNRRSFLHDTENGLVVLDPAFYNRVRAVFQGYIDQAEQLDTTDTDIRAITRELFHSERVRDLF